MTRTLPPLNLPLIVNGNVLALPLRPGSVSLFVSSPPYWALRVYEDAGEVYDGQIGSEPDPVLFLRNLWRSMDAAWDALRDDGVGWINLGDKYAGSGGHNNSAIAGPAKQTERDRAGGERRSCAACNWTGTRATCPKCGGRTTRPERDGFRSEKAAAARDTSRAELDVPAATRASRRREGIGRAKPDTRDRARAATRRNAPDRYSQGTEWARAKSLMGLPWAFVLGLLNPTLYRDHLDPPELVECETCHGADPADYVDDPPCTVCPTCDGDGEVEVPWPQWIYRAEQVWDKPNGLPESIDDRPRRSHEVWLMVAKNGDHYAALDDLREPYDPNAHAAGPDGAMWRDGPMAATWGLAGSQSIPTGSAGRTAPHPLGKLPGSVWRISSEPFVDVLYHLDTEHARVLRVDELWHYVRTRTKSGNWDPVIVREAEHFAPFPSEWPRRLVLGWSPAAICTVCDEGRVPVVTQMFQLDHFQTSRKVARLDGNHPERDYAAGYHGRNRTVGSYETTIVGYACACTPRTDHGPAGSSFADDARNRSGRRPEPDGAQNLHKARRPRYEYHFDGWEAPPTRPSVVVDFFSGTATTALVAAALDRLAVGIDLSWDYCQLGKWRASSPKQRARARARTLANRQGTLAI